MGFVVMLSSKDIGRSIVRQAIDGSGVTLTEKEHVEIEQKLRRLDINANQQIAMKLTPLIPISGLFSETFRSAGADFFVLIFAASLVVFFASDLRYFNR